MTAPTFYYDAEDELVIAKFPEDFADFLADEGWDYDARDFLARWKQIEALTPNSELKFEQVIELAKDYANVYEIGDETRRPTSKTYDQIFNLLRDMEQAEEPDGDDESIPWDREAALVNRFISDMPTPRHEPEPEEDEDVAGPEFPDVVLTLNRGDELSRIVLYSIVALGQAGYPEEARELLGELSFEFERDRGTDAEKIIETICAYITLEVASV